MDILVVDDSKAMRMIVKRNLRQAGYGEAEVTEASNGVEALGLIRSNDFDLVLSDWNMPEMSGIELLQATRSEGIKVNFGFVTSEGSPEIRKLAQEHGALFLIVKPFTPDALEKAVDLVGA